MLKIIRKLLGINELTVDNKLSVMSDNPVANKAIASALSNKQDRQVFKTINGESIVGEGNITIPSEPQKQLSIESSIVEGSNNPVSSSAIAKAFAELKNYFNELFKVVNNSVTKSISDFQSRLDRLEFKTINGESIVGKGDIEIKGETVVNEVVKEVQVPVQSVTTDIGNAYHLPKYELTQSMLDAIPPRQTIVIGYDYELKSDIQFPDFSHIVFNGGCLKGAYKVTGNHCTINEDVAYAIFNDAVPVGFDLGCIDLRWVGGIPDYDENNKIGTDNYIYFKRAIDLTGKFYNGLYIKLVGKYYIGTTLTTEYDVNICGSHFPSRWATVNSSPSVIAVGAGVTAFKMMGHNPGGKDWNIAYLFIKNLKVVGHSTSNSVFVEYKAMGCPTRISSIEECEFVGLRYGLFVNIERHAQYNVDTSLGNLSILKCLAYECAQFIRGYSAEKLSNSWVGNVFNNVAIRDCNIEHNNSKYSIELGSRESDGIHGTVFGNAVIDNCNLEGQPSPIRIVCGYGNATISNCYFEATSGNYVMELECTNQNSRLILMNNYYSVHNKKVKANFKNRHIFDNAEVC